jgi:tRNA-specific 2-thiouridylase
MYVLSRDAQANRVVVGPKEALATNRVPLENAILHRSPEEVETVRLRYHSQPLACRVHVLDDGSVELALDHSANGVAPGQLACLMRQDRVVGEGTIGEPR